MLINPCNFNKYHTTNYGSSFLFNYIICDLENNPLTEQTEASLSEY